MAEVQFPAYRRYRQARIAASDALMALLIGARLGEHALRTSAASEDMRLPELFGRIPGIERVNRTAGDAARLLAEAEAHLASMGIPYVLAIHGVYLSEVIRMLRADGKDDASTPWNIEWREQANEIPLMCVHEYIVERSNNDLPAVLLEQFHMGRRLRNRLLHSAGSAGSRVLAEYRGMSRGAKDGWERLAGRPLSADASGRLRIGEGELVAVLAVTHGLAKVINGMLVSTLSRDFWAGLVVDDYSRLEPQRFGEASQRIRRLRGHARIHYGVLLLSDAELQVAAVGR